MSSNKPVALIVGAHNEEIEASICFLPQRLVKAGWRVIFFNPIGCWNWTAFRAKSDKDQARIKKGVLDAATFLGCEKIVWDYNTQDGWNWQHELPSRMAKMLRETSPTLVFAHWPNDTHPDHKLLARMTLQVLYMGNNLLEDFSYKPTWKEVWGYQAGIGQTYNFWPDALVLGDKKMMVKGKAALQRTGYDLKTVNIWWADMVAKANYWGHMAGGIPAEGLKFMGPQFPLHGTLLHQVLGPSLVPIDYEFWTKSGDM